MIDLILKSAEWNLELYSGFEPGTPNLVIQRPNHLGHCSILQSSLFEIDVNFGEFILTVSSLHKEDTINKIQSMIILPQNHSYCLFFTFYFLLTLC